MQLLPELVSIAVGDSLGVLPVNESGVVAYFANDIPHSLDESIRRQRVFLYFGKYKKCQQYMTELEKELAAFGKLVKVEVGK